MGQTCRSSKCHRSRLNLVTQVWHSDRIIARVCFGGPCAGKDGQQSGHLRGKARPGPSCMQPHSSLAKSRYQMRRAPRASAPAPYRCLSIHLTWYIRSFGSSGLGPWMNLEPQAACCALKVPMLAGNAQLMDFSNCHQCPNRQTDCLVCIDVACACAASLLLLGVPFRYGHRGILSTIHLCDRTDRTHNRQLAAKAAFWI